MMGRQRVDQSQLFYLFNLEEQIPADHLLRRLAPQYAEWLATLDYLESLNPIRIVAGHTKPGLPDDSFAIDWTRGYIRAFAKAARTAKSSREMAAMIHALYPNAVNFPGTEFLVEVPTQVATGEIPPWNE